MGANDGSVLAFTQLLDNGPRNLRYNIALVAEGYTEAEMPRFRSHCRSFLRALFFTPPYDLLRCTFNVFALEVASTASGVDDPMTCGDGTTGSGAMPATYFDATMCGGGRVRRLMALDSRAVRDRVVGHLPEAHAVLVLVNSSFAGGTQGEVAVFTTNAGWEATALHEWGHLFGLADEYGCYVCDRTDDGRRYDLGDAIVKGYGLPDQPNVTADGPRSGLKWGSMVASTTMVPTMPGSVPAGTVGMFESAKYYDLGLFRPEETCAMRDPGSGFCTVCRSAITTAVAPYTPTTTCSSPTASPASITLTPRILRKARIATARGGYDVRLDAVTNLPASSDWGFSLLGATSWTGMPLDRVVRVFINDAPGGTYRYDQPIQVIARADPDDLPFWSPTTMPFTEATSTAQVALPRPVNAANRLEPDYANVGNLGGPGVATLSFARFRAGNGWLYLRTQKQYSRLAMTLTLDDGYFSPQDDPSWTLRSITWTPTPATATGRSASYDVTFDANGLCRLDGTSGPPVDPSVGFEIRARGTDAIGQDFDVRGRLIPTNLETVRSVSTVQIARIPAWEWPMRVDIPESVLETVVDGVVVSLVETVLTIDDLEIELQDARE